MKPLPNILIVDDLDVNLKLLEEICKNIRVNLIKALSGNEALVKTKGIELALAIVDIKMPGMNGYELALKLNEKKSDVKVPIIFITANYFDEVEVFKGYGSGAVDYIFKPVNAHILRSKINVFIDLFDQKQTILRKAKLRKELVDELTISNVNLRKSEEKYRNYIDNAPDGIFVADETGRNIEVNEAACRITGYSKNELLKMSISDVLTEESLEEGLAQFRKMVKLGTLNTELMFKHKNRTTRWWILETVKLSETRFLGFTKDITKSKKIEEELQKSLEQLQQLSEHIEQARENERLNISRELHDDLGQALTAVKIDLEIIKQQTSDIVVKEKLDNVKALVGNTIKSVQRITSQLRPEIIDDLGLEAAIDWYTKEFSKRYGIEVFLDIDSEIPISKDKSLPLFRIVQESLTNIARHARAKHVEILLNKQGDVIQLVVADNGVGITEDEINSKKSFGIMSMSERTASLGGSFEISRGNDFGSKILVTFPINKDKL